MNRELERMGLTPLLTTSAGACLTLANWQEVGIKAVAYALESLLMKPGVAFFKSTNSDLRHYTAWPRVLVLNASLPAADKEGVYKLRSPYDGSVVHFDTAALFSFVKRLQPDRLVLPQGFVSLNHNTCEQLAENIVLFIPASEMNRQHDYGLYLYYDAKNSFADFMQQVSLLSARPLYIAGDFDLLQTDTLRQQGIMHLESDRPANDALLGKVYSDMTTIALLDSEMAEQHQPIDRQCTCPTCSQQFTRAYLHHLLQQTPLLAQRLLIQHNVYYYARLFQPTRQLHSE